MGSVVSVLRPSLERHKQAFRRVPHLYGADRGFFSERNLTLCESGGVTIVCIPQSGGTRSPEREACERAPAFKQGQRFRAGIEGRISVLFRGRGMKRCLARGIERFELLIGAAVLARQTSAPPPTRCLTTANSISDATDAPMRRMIPADKNRYKPLSICAPDGCIMLRLRRKTAIIAANGSFETETN